VVGPVHEALRQHREHVCLLRAVAGGGSQRRLHHLVQQPHLVARVDLDQAVPLGVPGVGGQPEQ
jgi:hypothetical protein